MTAKSIVPSDDVHRSYTPFNETELDLIDGWRFARRISDRSKAIRALVIKGLASEGVPVSQSR